MQNEKDKPPSYYKIRIIAIFFVLSLCLTIIVTYRLQNGLPDYQPGDIAGSNIKSPYETPIPSLGITIKKGEIIVREGERVNSDHLAKLHAIKEKGSKDTFAARSFISIFLLIFSISLIFYEFSARNIKKFQLTEKDIIFCSSLILFTTLFIKILFLISHHISNSNAVSIMYLAPVFLFGIIMRIVLFSEAAIIFSLLIAIVTGIMFDMSMTAFLYVLTGNIVASYFSGKCEDRNTIIKAGIFTAFIVSLLAIIFDLMAGRSLIDLPLKILFILINGVASSFIALGLLPIIEYAFDYTTDIKLLELANLDNPLLRDMMVNAPGTYHHSIIVGNLSKAAAEGIGAHPLLARVSSYYHDIGKLKMPHYFIENRKGFEDAHKNLTPNMSSLIILSHVKEGVELADKYKLGKKIKDIIKEHHGTTLVSYFFNRAKEQEDPGLYVIDEKDFRYAGPKPQTKEAGIVMLADVVEASSRILDDPTPKRIEKHVQDVIERIFLDGQLDECELTLKDLHAIQKSFINILLGIFHQRIEYPERAGHNGSDKRLTKTAEDKQKTDQKTDRRVTNIFRATG
ncbi:MAG TPA: HDIG domain-containing protein [Syntrophorhabdaceae bacterium]|nr:HDIG domain-containing protein [Syntrophorhabdaceae bacterium]HOL04659.1 HDIG domain-containing protein [Syntrophorhabdaceae bacterium]HON85163.1 HDIG domain-containing protein [Syntrophorhabdaceae bacterium]HPC66094.1 HDIG domain-containing protein [Syntrophorhabdaceae bacterium]HPP41088.1 HDIG domain-containing protein [Syntrophorhabdaceae bacterium]